MREQADFNAPADQQPGETTGRYVVTFRDESLAEGLSLLGKKCGLKSLPSAADFEESAFDFKDEQITDGAVFPSLGIAVVNLEEKGLNSLMSASADSSVLAVEPETLFYASDHPEILSAEYLSGFRDALTVLVDKVSSDSEAARDASVGGYVDDGSSTWGLKATDVVNSKYTGRGVKIAVLDTGMDLRHPDFRGRLLSARSFIAGQEVQDRNGHGTHCIGTACGRIDHAGRRYGVAGDAEIFVGKVLSDRGSGPTSGILAGIEWAVANNCQVISMSLGNRLTSSSTAYETVGRRALASGSLIVAAAGNHFPNPEFVGQPANSPSIMAVAALTSDLARARFSAVSGPSAGANIDVAAPGVSVYSSWPVGLTPSRYRSISGTSMATPHVAGIAAQFAEAYGATGSELWRLVTSHARRLQLPSGHVGSGLAQAPR